MASSPLTPVWPCTAVRQLVMMGISHGRLLHVMIYSLPLHEQHMEEVGASRLRRTAGGTWLAAAAAVAAAARADDQHLPIDRILCCIIAGTTTPQASRNPLAIASQEAGERRSEAAAPRGQPALLPLLLLLRWRGGRAPCACGPQAPCLRPPAAAALARRAPCASGPQAPCRRPPAAAALARRAPCPCPRRTAVRNMTDKGV